MKGGKTLVLVNSHASAYDEGGVIRAQQMEMLFSFMEEEYKKGGWKHDPFPEELEEEEDEEEEWHYMSLEQQLYEVGMSMRDFL